MDHPTPTSFSHLAFLSTSASSYTSDSGDRLPRLEQSFCKGYYCCGINLDDLHGLLEHFEEHHVLGTSPAGSILANQIAAVLPPQSKDLASSKGANQLGQAQSSPAGNPSNLPSGGAFSMDDIDMEMDDDLRLGNFVSPTSLQNNNANQAGVNRVKPPHPLAFSTRRSASPHSTNSSPDMSAPSTPTMDSDMESDFDPSASSSSLHFFPPMGTITPSMLYPRKRSNSPPVVFPDHFSINSPAFNATETPQTVTGNQLQQQSVQPQVLQGSGSTSTGAPIIMGTDPTSTTLNPLNLGPGQQGFVAPPPTLPSGRVWTPPASKPFKCPVPGCDKAYKQQNGLKYHRLHGHCNNRGRDSSTAASTPVEDDGRETLEEKPYGCYVGAGCGKRYKNMNGLRYHYQHSGPHGQIGLQMLAVGSHPPPLGGAASRGSRASSAASSRNHSRANSPEPQQVPLHSQLPQFPKATGSFPSLPLALSGH